MLSRLRVGLAVLAGALVSIVLAYVGLLVLLLATRGIPLGATPRETTPGEYLALLLIAAVAAAIGRLVAVNAAPQHGRAVAWMLAITLAIIMLWGFSGSPGWPSWWGPAVASTFGTGVWLGGIRTQPTRRRSGFGL